MRNILLATDFSPSSRNAAGYAVSLAHYFNATLHLVNVAPPQIIMDDYILAPVLTTHAEIVTENAQLMKKEVKILSKIYPVNITTRICEGYASEVIPELAIEDDMDLIVVGPKGKGRSRFIFGSTTRAVIRKSTHPVFIIPENATFEPLRHIILALDFDSEIKMHLYKVLIRLADKFKSGVKIINIAKKHAPINKKEIIGIMEANMAFSRHECRFYSINEENVEAGINAFMEENHCDVLAMVANRHSLITRIFGKGYTRTMSAQTKKPLLLL